MHTRPRTDQSPSGTDIARCCLYWTWYHYYCTGSCISSFLSPGTMTLLPDCELHLSIHARLHARNDTHLSSTILYYIINNRCHLWFLMFHYFVCYFHVVHIFILLLFYFFLFKSSSFYNLLLNIKLTYGVTYDVIVLQNNSNIPIGHKLSYVYSYLFVITLALAASGGKSNVNVTVWRLSVRLSRFF